MRVSVVICTYNRRDGLAETLECLKLQRYEDFEVVVVNGPSTDGTADYLATLTTTLKVVDNPAANLSISRNLGIHAAAGDVVAFIDDDALPEPNWLEQAIPFFEDPDVAGVGGIVFDHSGMALQYRFSASSRYGAPTFSALDPFDRMCVPGSATFPYLQGTNSLFRRSALGEIGCFDETFDFYLDETDVCIRLVDAGFQLRQLSDAPVHHKYLPSARRNEAKVVTNWSSMVRNTVYFGYRHAWTGSNEHEIFEHTDSFVEYIHNDARYHEEMGVVPEGHLKRAIEGCGKAIADGIVLGRERAHLRLGPIELDESEFVRFERSHDDVAGLRVVLVSSGYTPNLTGGISRFIADVAPELARRGHEVRVFTRCESVPTVDLEDGVWVHRLELAPTPGVAADAPAHIDGFATAVLAEMTRLETWWNADVVYGSLWDVETLGLSRERPDLPIVPMLATPVAEVAEHEGWTDADHPAHEASRQIIALEREVLENAACIHAISDAIVDTFERLYPDAIDEERLQVAHIGRSDDGDSIPSQPAGPLTVLFIGRLEARKGIDTFLDAAAELLPRHRELRIVVAGDDRRPGPSGETYPAWWRQQRVRGAERLRFLGMVDDEELTDLIRDSTVVVMPSRYESFGLVVVEAMMHGRAVVASDVGGISELVVPGETGILTPVGDGEKLAGAISSLVVDSELAALMGQNGRQRFDEHLRADQAAERLEHVLRTTVSAHSRLVGARR